MGVGFAVDLVVCSALGVDMYDCVFPTRTARFGSALTFAYPGSLNLKTAKHAEDLRPIEEDCDCSTCANYSRAYIHSVIKEPTASHLLTVHNVAFQLRLMRKVRAAIANGTFPQFIRDFMLRQYPDRRYPTWAVNALRAVNVDLL